MHTYVFSLFTLATNVIVKGAIDCLKWGREAKLGSELNSELNRSCGMNKRTGHGAEKMAKKLLLLVIYIPINDLSFTVFSMSAFCADGL